VWLATGSELLVDRSTLANTFDGIGGLSGGGATSVLLPLYKEPVRSQILDYLFKPNFGASLQILKVEIGGDSQSTDGTESSHMHTPDTVNLHTGYEWWLMSEAKKRNPDIKLYGLAWAFPGWVGKSTGSPFQYPDLTSKYLVEWVKGAKHQYNLDIDYLGVWNERSSDSTFVQTLRKALDKEGVKGTKIVAKDGGSEICDDMAKDKPYNDSIDIIGLHYPSDFNNLSVCKSLHKPIWSSEESSSYDDLNGAACWGRIMNAHWVINQMTSSIMWNLVGSYYHGTSWYASSMLTAVEPWSGHYEVNPVIWATAHITQFTKIGWKYLSNGKGSGYLPGGGFYATWVDPDSGDFTMNVVKISHDHAQCTRPRLPPFNVSSESVSFYLADSMKAPEELQVWYSNFETYSHEPSLFEHSTVKVKNGKFTISVPIGAMYTVTTVKTGSKGSFGTPPMSSPSFPLPHLDDFQSTGDSKNAAYFSDQIGSFEIHTSDDGRKSLKQMVPELPIGWSDGGSNGPMTLIGMREWQDVYISAKFKLPPHQGSDPQLYAACVAARVDQMWNYGVVLCIDSSGAWNLTNKGPALNPHKGAPAPVLKGRAHSAVGTGVWHSLSLTVHPSGSPDVDAATGSIGSEVLFANATVRNLDTGFGAIGANRWFPIEFRDISISRAQSGWATPKECVSGKDVRGEAELTVEPCARNGLISTYQQWTLLPSYQLLHTPSQQCAAATPAGKIVLAKCDSTDEAQLFRNDYTMIRNTEKPVTVGDKTLVGFKSGKVALGQKGDWNAWSYFPNTGQLRNQYVAKFNLGYPLCLSTCAPTAKTQEILI